MTLMIFATGIDFNDDWQPRSEALLASAIKVDVRALVKVLPELVCTPSPCPTHRRLRTLQTLLLIMPPINSKIEYKIVREM